MTTPREEALETYQAAADISMLSSTILMEIDKGHYNRLDVWPDPSFIATLTKALQEIRQRSIYICANLNRSKVVLEAPPICEKCE